MKMLLVSQNLDAQELTDIFTKAFITGGRAKYLLS